jgi:hypothetical protein
VELPDSVLDLLGEAVREMAYGGVAVVAALQPELTTLQAAELLNVSRQHFVGLLERGECRTTGTAPTAASARATCSPTSGRGKPAGGTPSIA